MVSEADLSAFWLYPDWDGPLKEPFWMRPPKVPVDGYYLVTTGSGFSHASRRTDWRFNGALVAYEAKHGTKGLAEYRALLERTA